MVSQIIECLRLMNPKRNIETVFDADRHVQYEEMRREMTKLYDDVFRSVSLPDTEIKVK